MGLIPSLSDTHWVLGLGLQYLWVLVNRICIGYFVKNTIQYNAVQYALVSISSIQKLRRKKDGEKSS